MWVHQHEHQWADELYKAGNQENQGIIEGFYCR